LQSGSGFHLNSGITASLSSGLSGSSGSSAVPLTVHSFHAPGSVQALIATTLKIPVALLDRSKRDIRFAYAKYQAIHDAMRQINQMASAGSWTQKVLSMMISLRSSARNPIISNSTRNRSLMFQIIQLCINGYRTTRTLLQIWRFGIL
jgi:hypothetical protein